jgi:hypothetical protein
MLGSVRAELHSMGLGEGGAIPVLRKKPDDQPLLLKLFLCKIPIAGPQFQSALNVSCSYLQVLVSPTCPSKFLRTLVIHTLTNLASGVGARNRFSSSPLENLQSLCNHLTRELPDTSTSLECRPCSVSPWIDVFRWIRVLPEEPFFCPHKHWRFPFMAKRTPNSRRAGLEVRAKPELGVNRE